MLITPGTVEAAKRLQASLDALIWKGAPARYFYIVNKRDKIVDVRPHREMPGIDVLVTIAARKERDEN